MSSLHTRTLIKSFINTNFPTEHLVDFSAEFQYINDVLAAAGATAGPWIGIQFIGHSEHPVGLTAHNTKGRYLESGAFYIHVVNVAAIGVANGILTRAEALRDKFRGQRIDDILIVAMTSPNFEEGAAISFENGYTGASFLVSYDRYFDL